MAYPSHRKIQGAGNRQDLGLRQGAADYVVKPVNPEELLKKIAELPDPDGKENQPRDFPGIPSSVSPAPRTDAAHLLAGECRRVSKNWAGRPVRQRRDCPGTETDAGSADTTVVCRYRQYPREPLRGGRFLGLLRGAPTPQNSSTRLPLVGSKYGANAALLVNRMLGLKTRDFVAEIGGFGSASLGVRHAF